MAFPHVIIQQPDIPPQLYIVILHIRVIQQLALVHIFQQLRLLRADPMQNHQQLVLQIRLVSKIKRQSNNLNERPFNHLVNVLYFLPLVVLLEF